ncbi:SDR family NAD(P)-dependent oxidoreductase [Mariprofundus sp. KV]|uniref:SDR family NAD(P)-dependent oxidoreductase n=1 Tax=Mariprofundus sp. KV TaxID=2608715 RepID=UPI0015A27106|nr:SDR family NAD(P)-dependent oxidoreductase [Mariprofundus sp. KV]NWF36105.1 SDR family NAD(P)-dependent oxidoreductase [Mariprofundus sp. KV]
MSQQFKDRIIMVTGASDGIGQQVAAALGEAGASVIALGRSEDGLQQTMERVEELGSRCLCIPFDLNDFDNYGKLFLSLKDQIPHLDGLVHCAGDMDRCTPLQYVKVDDFRKMLDIHLTAPNMLTQIMFPLLRRAEAASVIFTSCDMVDKDMANWHGYGMAKRALAYAAAMWQMEHPDKPFRFNTLNPGRVRTKLFKRTYGGEHPDMVPPASSVTPAYLYLLSDESKALRGQTVHASDLFATKQ